MNGMTMMCLERMLQPFHVGCGSGASILNHSIIILFMHYTMFSFQFPKSEPIVAVVAA
jgi:hypothetical protein